MPHIYITESNLKLGHSAGQLTVKNVGDGSERTVPFNTVDGISVFGKSQLSTQLIRECIAKDIPIGFYSDDGHFFGHITSSAHINPLRQKLQIYLTDNTEFCLMWSRNIVAAKIMNSLSLLQSQSEVYEFTPEELHGINHSLGNLSYAQSVDQLLGFEGNAAKCYFDCLPKLLRNEDFIFKGRSARPPKDPFNSMLSYGYSLFYRNIIGAIERHGLHPYFAYMHKIKFGHAALASDLIEEYRAPLVDKTVLDVINNGEIDISDFYTNDAGAVYMTKRASKMLTDLFSNIIARNEQYFYDAGDRKSYGFQVMLDKKILNLIEAIEKRDAGVYRPYIWKLADSVC
jgi:CRISPR-associated protein Cas1